MASMAAFACACIGSTPGERARDALLAQTWEAYKQAYIHADGYVIDRSRGQGQVTSEGQGYALLRAAWIRDEPAFTRVLRWTDQYLRRSDGLYSWLWTPDQGGRVLDANSATDADQEIALALILASAAFDRPDLRENARALLAAVRRHEALDVQGHWFPAAGNWAIPQRIANLSYFLPYAYPYFDRVDPDGGWLRVIDIGYDAIAATLERPRIRLIPDFVTLTPDGRTAPLPDGVPLSGDFASDAMRVYWRVAVDCQLHRRARACADPLGASRLAMMLERDGALYTRYALDGTPIERFESISFYGIAAPFFARHAPETGRLVRSRHLTPDVLRSVSASSDRYYDANWTWFGIAAGDGFIVDQTPRVR